MQNTLKLQMVAKTNVGKVREHNEDNFVVSGDLTTTWVVPAHPYYNPSSGSIMVVADGMGGMNAGEIASKITIESISTFFRENNSNRLTPAERLIESIQYAHKQILEYAQVNSDAEGMGTTVVITHIINDKLYVAWSGDSRCYLFRGGKLSQLTKDHSYVQTLLDEGKITKTQAFYHPQSNVIIQSLGDSDRPPVPDIAVETLYKNDIVLLCSDGLNSMLEDLLIEGFLQNHSEDLTLCADKLIEAANNAGGNDNITVVLNQVVEGNYYLNNDDNKNIIDNQNDTLPNNKNAPKKRVNTGVWILLGMLVAVGVLLTWYYPDLQKTWEKKQSKNTNNPSPKNDTIPLTATPLKKTENTSNKEVTKTKDPKTTSSESIQNNGDARSAGKAKESQNMDAQLERIVRERLIDSSKNSNSTQDKKNLEDTNDPSEVNQKKKKTEKPNQNEIIKPKNQLI